MSAPKKLFISHAGEFAHRLSRAVRPHGLVSAFASSYGRRHHRTGVVDHPDRLKDLETTLGREAILVMVAEILRRIPASLGARRGRAPAPEEATFARMFVAEFMQAVIRSFDWPSDDFESENESFERDLLIYRRWSERALAPDDPMVREGSSPFLDRCALLLDSAMIEQAREAAAEFEEELVRASIDIMRQFGLPAAQSVNRSEERVSQREKPKKPRVARPARKKAKARPPKRKRPSKPAKRSARTPRRTRHKR